MKEVAATYQNWERNGKPFSEDGSKYYIRVINPKTNKEKIVRWYGEIIPDYKKLLGFDKGYITVFKGITKENRDYFSKSNARYAWFFGWYIVSTESVPANLPVGVEAVRLNWQDTFTDANIRKQEVEKLIGDIYNE